MSSVDFMEVGRVAHQLARDHGRTAYMHAARLAHEAESAGKSVEAEFWHAVSAALAPR